MKYFLFDIGHVLVDFDFQDFLDAVSSASGRSCGPLTERDMEIHDAVERGHISDVEWVDYLNRAKGLSWTVDDLVDVWSGMFTLHETGRRLFLDMLDAGVDVYTLSNIAKHHMDAIENNWSGFFDGVGGFFLSYEIGIRKPNSDIYRHALERLEATGDQCFFIDDRPENIEAARAVGIHAHQFIPENHEAICEAAARFFELS